MAYQPRNRPDPVGIAGFLLIVLVLGVLVLGGLAEQWRANRSLSNVPLPSVERRTR